jgi:hypothetical protein
MVKSRSLKVTPLGAPGRRAVRPVVDRDQVARREAEARGRRQRFLGPVGAVGEIVLVDRHGARVAHGLRDRFRHRHIVGDVHRERLCDRLVLETRGGVLVDVAHRGDRRRARRARHREGQSLDVLAVGGLMVDFVQQREGEAAVRIGRDREDVPGPRRRRQRVAGVVIGIGDRLTVGRQTGRALNAPIQIRVFKRGRRAPSPDRRRHSRCRSTRDRRPRPNHRRWSGIPWPDPCRRSDRPHRPRPCRPCRRRVGC